MRSIELARSKLAKAGKVMKPPAETGFTLPLLYALPLLAVKFFSLCSGNLLLANRS